MRFVFQLLPCLTNLIAGMALFISAKRMAESSGPVMVALTMSVWALVYALFSGLFGFVQTKKNASTILIAGQIVTLFSMAGFLCFPGDTAQYIWLFLLGIGNAAFFGPFQVVVKLLDSGSEHAASTVARSTAVYTFSWSFGYATGPFITSFVWGMGDPSTGWKTCYLFNILLIVFLLICMFRLRGFILRKLSAEENVPVKEEPGTSPLTELPDLVKLGWIIGGIGFTTIAMLRTGIPYRCTVLKMTTAQQGFLMAIVSYVQAFGGLLCWRSKYWMYRPCGVVLAVLCGTGSLLCFAFAERFEIYLLAAFLYGCYSAVFCFNYTYHALANPRQSHKYVGVNEFIVGMTSVFAPLAGGVLAKSSSALPFVAAALLAFLTIFFHVAVTWKYRKLR